MNTDFVPVLSDSRLRIPYLFTFEPKDIRPLRLASTNKSEYLQILIESAIVIQRYTVLDDNRLEYVPLH